MNWVSALLFFAELMIYIIQVCSREHCTLVNLRESSRRNAFLCCFQVASGTSSWNACEARVPKLHTMHAMASKDYPRIDVMIPCCKVGLLTLASLRVHAILSLHLVLAQTVQGY